MTETDLTPLDADLRALLERAGGLETPAPGAEARVLERVEAILSTPPGRGHGDEGGGASHPGSLGPPRVSAIRRLLPLATLALGGALGAVAARASLRSPRAVLVPLPPQIVYVEPAASAPAVEAPSTPVAPRATAAASRGTDDLLAERALLDLARAAIERRDGTAALAATREHERRFPAGLLLQEREAMAIRALVLVGRHDEARARMGRFRARFPGSVLIPALDSQISGPSSSP
jgi:hypothetical protein